MPLPHYNPTLNNTPSAVNNFASLNSVMIETKKTDINLNNPIFVAYINTSNLNRQAAEEVFYKTKQMFEVYNNITVWIINSNETKIECVYDGQCKTRDIEISELIKEINTRIDIMSKSSSFEDFKINIRDWRINELVDGSQKK